MTWSNPKRLVLAGVLAVSGVTGAGLAIGHRPAVLIAENSPAGVWHSELAPAMTAARAQHRDVLIEFRAPEGQSMPDGPGTDRDKFARAIGADFVLVKMTPSNEMSPAQITRITTMAERFGVARFPTYVLLDPQGLPYAKSETFGANPDGYKVEFKQLLASRERRDASLALASETAGLTRAGHLEDALAAVSPFAAEYGDLQRQIIELDPANETGLRAKYEPGLLAKQLDSVIQNEVYPLADQGQYPAAIARIDRLMSETNPTRGQRQLLTAFKGQLYYSVGDKHQADVLLEEAIAVDPTSESAARARAAKAQWTGGT